MECILMNEIKEGLVPLWESDTLVRINFGGNSKTFKLNEPADTFKYILFVTPSVCVMSKSYEAGVHGAGGGLCYLQRDVNNDYYHMILNSWKFNDDFTQIEITTGNGFYVNRTTKIMGASGANTYLWGIYGVR